MANAYVRLLSGWLGGVKKGQKYAHIIFEWSLSNFEFDFKNTWAPLCVLVLHPVQWILLTTYHVFARKTKCTFLLVILHFIMTMGPFFVSLQKHQNIGLNWSLIGHTLFSFDLIFYCPNKKYKGLQIKKIKLKLSLFSSQYNVLLSFWCII